MSDPKTRTARANRAWRIRGDARAARRLADHGWHVAPPCEDIRFEKDRGKPEDQWLTDWWSIAAEQVREALTEWRANHP
jgi:hypothetical protein